MIEIDQNTVLKNYELNQDGYDFGQDQDDDQTEGDSYEESGKLDLKKELTKYLRR